MLPRLTTPTPVTVSGAGSTTTSYADANGAQYKSYWGNIGNNKWSYSGGGDPYQTEFEAKGSPRHLNTINTLYVDGHVKSVQYSRLVDDQCAWFIPGSFTKAGATYNIDTSACP